MTKNKKDSTTENRSLRKLIRKWASARMGIWVTSRRRIFVPKTIRPSVIRRIKAKAMV